MNTPSILTGALTAGILLISTGATATAQYRSGMAQAIDGIERSTDHLFTHYKKELQSRGLWKPRGAYSQLYSATFRMEEYGDAMKKYYGKRASLASLARIAANIERELATANHVLPYVRVSRGIHNDIASLSRAVHSINGFCVGHGGTGYRTDQRSHSNDRVYRDNRSSRSNDRVYRDNRSSRSKDRVYRDRDERSYRHDDRTNRRPSRDNYRHSSSDRVRSEVQRWVKRQF